MRIAVVGTGYVGLVAGAGFAEFGNRVACIDTDQKKIERLKNGEIPIYEPGLEDLVKRNAKEDRLWFTTSLPEGVKDAEVVLIAVGTPQGEDGSADMKYVMGVADELARSLDHEAVVVLKSTVPVGTNDRVQALLDQKGRVRARVVNNPEFLKEGDAVHDFLRPDRVVVGARDDVGRAVMQRLYAPLQMTNDRLMFMSPRSAEMTKYVANAMLATRISFMNEIARLCEATGADVNAVRRGAGSDSRIGPKFLFPGPGYGGSCFPKDVSALIHLGREHDVKLEVVSAVAEVNVKQKEVLFQKVARQLGTLKDTRVAVWGLAFKPKTDDVREAPALVLIEMLLAAGAEVRAHDPEARAQARIGLGAKADKVIFVDHPYDATVGADALVLVTEWQEYRSPDFERLKAQMRRHVIVDGRNVWQALAPQRLGFKYEGIGIHVESA